MTNAIIDNSTLSAVERVVGKVPTKPNYDLTGDLSAFDSYLAALLFYDNPVRIDDYKPEFAKARAQNFPELGTVKFEDSTYDDFDAAAREISSAGTLSIQAGDVEENDLGQFLRDLDLHVCPAWVMQSSDFFLRIRLLSDASGAQVEKYSPLMSAIFDQLSENKNSGKKPDWRKTLLDASGNPIKETAATKSNGAHSIGKDLHAFSAGLNWLAQRSVFYALVAESLDGAAVCHPIRNDYLARFFCDRLIKNGPDQRKAIMAEFQARSIEVVDSSNALLGGSGFKLASPVVSAWATLKSGSPRKAVDFVNEVRFSSEAITLRARLRDLEDLVKFDGVEQARVAAVRLFKDLQVSMGELFRKYAAKGDDPYRVSVNLMTLTGSFSASGILDKAGSLLPARRRSMALLRNITLDVLQNPALGSLSDKLRSDRLVEGSPWDAVYEPKIDKPRFRYSRPYWKKPME
jgi:hypothetical protein|tara:strand:+ start:485 stop:1867 length:1383 start_codon:yes stop_codon:yes gene_type:complete